MISREPIEVIQPRVGSLDPQQKLALPYCLNNKNYQQLALADNHSPWTAAAYATHCIAIMKCAPFRHSAVSPGPFWRAWYILGGWDQGNALIVVATY